MSRSEPRSRHPLATALAPSALILAAALSGCMPSPMAKGFEEPSTQHEFQSVAQWDALVRPMAGRVAEQLQVLQLSGPLYVERLDDTVPFTAHVRRVLMTDLAARGIQVAPTRAQAAARLHLAVATVDHARSRSVPPGLPTAVAVAGWGVAELADHSAGAAVAVGTALAEAAVRAAGNVGSDLAEVTLAVSLVQGDRVAFTQDLTTYVKVENLPLYTPRTPGMPLLMAEATPQPVPEVRVLPVRQAR